MTRERALKIILVIVGLLFLATAYPLLFLVRDEPTLQMMLSVYATLGVFLLLSSRNPSAHRSLIAFAAWSSFAHAATMAVQAFFAVTERAHLLYGVVMFVIIGLALIVATPARATTNAGNRSFSSDIRASR